jgi:hypothetical protein
MSTARTPRVALARRMAQRALEKSKTLPGSPERAEWWRSRLSKGRRAVPPATTKKEQ